MKTAKRNYYASNVKRSNPAAWYHEIRVMTAGSSNSNCNIAVENIEQSDDRAVADATCSYFTLVGGDLQPLNPSLLQAYLPSLPVCHVQSWEVCRELGKIRSRKASGPDSISAKLISLSLMN